MDSALTASPSLADQAFGLLEEKLVTLALSPGKQVSEGQLIEMTGLGRTPVREAILRLAQHEMFVVLPRRGLLVTPIERASMAHILETRKPLERVILHRAALNARDDQRSELSAIARQLTFAHDDFDTFLRLDAELDNLFDQCAGNHYATAAVAPLRSHSRRFWYFHRSRIPLADSVSAHSKMARLVARRDFIGAQKSSDAVIGILERFVATLPAG